MARPANSEGRDTRGAVLSAALDLFAERGFHGTSMREIARAVGVRESALYHHFPNKQELFRVMASELGPRGAETVAGALDFELLQRDGTQTFLRGLVHRILDWWATPEQQKFAKVLMSEGFRPEKDRPLDPQQLVGRVIELFTALFAELIRRGHLRELDPEVLAQEWMGPILMIRLRFLMSRDAPDLKKAKAMADRHVAFFCAAVRP